MLVTILLAQTTGKDPDSILRPGTGTGNKFLGTEISLIFGIAIILAAALFFWAFFIRKRPKEARGARVLTRSIPTSKADDGSPQRRRRRKRRADHPDNWGRNPTLGETGGLPPPRPDEPEAPPERQAPPVQ